MDTLSLILFVSAGTLLLLCVFNFLLLAFSSGNWSKTEVLHQDLMTHKVRKIVVADKAAEAYLLLGEEEPDIRIIPDFNEERTKIAEKAKLLVEKRRHVLNQREKVAV